MTALVQQEPRALIDQDTGRMEVAKIISHVKAVQEVMQTLMKDKVHYGKIPGTPKPTLYKPGAELLCLAFHIAPTFRIEDLSTADAIRYRVTCIGSHQGTGVVLGEALGEASSGEEKYKWRKAVCDEEWDDTPVHLKRTKYGKDSGGNGFYRQKQVRTEPADLANTVLKMAVKRAQVAMVLNVLAVSDMFSQDLEDLDKTLRDHLADDDGGGQTDQAGQQGQQQQGGLEPWPDDSLEKRFIVWRGYLAAGKTHDDLIAFAKSKGTLTADQEKRIRELKPLPAEVATTVESAPAPAAESTQASQEAGAPAEAPAVTYAHVADKLNSAKSQDERDAAATLIDAVQDEKQRAELRGLYESLPVLAEA